MANFKIDPEFESAIDPPQPEELELLEASLRREGCRDPLRVWESESLLLDGHNRYRICEKWCLPYGVTYLDFPNREAALLWIQENQLGRRNLTDDQRAILVKSIERRRANTPEAKAAQTAAATAARKFGNVVPKTGTTINTNAALAAKHKVPRKKLEDAGTVLAAAEKPNAPQAVKDLPAKVKRGELKVAEARKIVAEASKKTARTPGGLAEGITERSFRLAEKRLNKLQKYSLWLFDGLKASDYASTDVNTQYFVGALEDVQETLVSAIAQIKEADGQRKRRIKALKEQMQAQLAEQRAEAAATTAATIQ
jgi:hypothetical protein